MAHRESTMVLTRAAAKNGGISTAPAKAAAKKAKLPEGSKGCYAAQKRQAEAAAAAYCARMKYIGTTLNVFICQSDTLPTGFAL